MRFFPRILCFLCLSLPLLGQQRYNLPHVAIGQGLQMTFIALNPGSTLAAVAISYRDDSGNPFAIEFEGLGNSSNHAFVLAPGETRFLTSTSQGDLRAGSATVISSVPIALSAIFTLLKPGGEILTETGISSSSPTSSFALAVDSGQLNTGLAIQNLAAEETEVNFTFYPTGVNPAATPLQTSRVLPALGHLAIFATGMGQLFPDATGSRGKMVVESDNDVAALTLRQGVGGAPLTTFPIVDTSSTATFFELPQVAKGSIIQTGFVTFNLTGTPGAVDVELTDNDGNPLEVELEGAALASAATRVPAGTASSSFSFPIEADGSLFFATVPAGDAVAGAAAITSTVPIGVTATFTLLDDQQNVLTEAGIGDSPRGTSFDFPFDTTGGFDTGIAIFNNNPSATDVQISFVGLDGQAFAREFQIQPLQVFGITPFANTSLAASGHSAQFVTQIISNFTDKRGRGTVQASNEVSVLPLRQKGLNVLTTLPIGAGQDGPGPGPTGSTLLPKTVGNFDLSLDRTLNLPLAGGFTLSGMFTKPMNIFPFGGITAVRTDNESFSGVTNFFGSYAVAVPAGTYDLNACLVVAPTMGALSINPAGGLSSITFLGASVEDIVVLADTQQNIPVLAPTLFDVSGTVTNLGSLPDNAIGSVSLLFSSSDSETSGIAPVSGDGTFTIPLAAGSYTVTAFIAQGEDANLDGIPEVITSAASLFNIGMLAVVGDSSGNNLAIPTLAAVSGEVTQTEVSPSGVAVPAGSSVLATDTLFPLGSVLRRCFPAAGGSVGMVSEGTYNFPVVAGRTHYVGAVIPALNLGTEEEGRWITPSPNTNTMTINNDVTLNFHFPAYPEVVTLSGTVSGPGGAPVMGVTVQAGAVAGLLGAPGTSFSVTTTTNAAGQYSLDVLAGTQYAITFTPPPPSLGGLPIP